MKKSRNRESLFSKFIYAIFKSKPDYRSQFDRQYKTKEFFTINTRYGRHPANAMLPSKTKLLPYQIEDISIDHHFWKLDNHWITEI